MVEAFTNDGFEAAIISIGIILLFALSEWLHRVRSVRVETTRKLTHVGAGLIVMSFPWVLNSPWTVCLLSFSFGILLLVGKKTGLLTSVHGVSRRTGGAYYYPFAVLGTFWLSKGDPLLFCVPIAVMALADTGAALAGQRVGATEYQVYDNHRTLEGSLVFFALAMGICLSGLAIAGHPGWPAMLYLALVAAIMSTATEAISVRGADNLFIPYTCFLVLDRTVRLGLHDLAGWLEGLLMGLVITVASYRIAGLTPSGGITVVVVVTLAWALGGWAWFIPLLAFYALYIGTTPRKGHIRADLDEVFPTVVGSMIVVLTFGHFGDSGLFIPYLATLAASGAITLSRMAIVRKWPVVPMAVSGAVAPVLPVFAYEADLPVTSMCISVIAGCTCFAFLARTPIAGRRMISTLMSGAVAWAVI